MPRETSLFCSFFRPEVLCLDCFCLPENLCLEYLSDGVDNKSQTQPLQVAKEGEDRRNAELLALVKVSNDYAFASENNSQALELCELETLLSMNEHPVISDQNWEKPIGSERVIKGILSSLGRSVKFEQVGFGVAPARREPRELSSQSMNVARAIETHSSQDTSAGADSGGLGVGEVRVQ